MSWKPTCIDPPRASRPSTSTRGSHEFWGNFALSPCRPPTRGYTRRPHDCPSSQLLSRGPGTISRSTDGGPQTGQRHPYGSRQAEEGFEGEPGKHPNDPAGPAGVRADGKGLRHAPRRAQVRPGEDEPDPQPVPDLPVEDDRRPLRASARRADQPAASLVADRRRGQYPRPQWPEPKSSSSPALREWARER